MPAREKHPESPDPHEPGRASADPARSIHEEHAELRALLADIQDAGLTSLLPLLGQLRTLLVEHFETEEGPDGFEAMTKKQPQYLPRLSEIFDEHRAFLERLDGISDRAKTYIKERQVILEDVRALAHELHEHEARENELLGDVLYTDLGGHN